MRDSFVLHRKVRRDAPYDLLDWSIVGIRVPRKNLEAF